MEGQSGYGEVKHIVMLTTASSCKCEHCDCVQQTFTGELNHYIDAHQYKLLYIGPETCRNESGELLHNTVAMLGCAEVPESPAAGRAPLVVPSQARVAPTKNPSEQTETP